MILHLVVGKYVVAKVLLTPVVSAGVFFCPDQTGLISLWNNNTPLNTFPPNHHDKPKNLYGYKMAGYVGLKNMVKLIVLREIFIFITIRQLYKS